MDFKYYSVKEIIYFLKEKGISCQKKFGQNFLIDPAIADSITESLEINENDLVLEIGCGIGSLTNKILGKGCRVIGFEIDRAFIRFLKEYFTSDKFTLIEGDFLKEADKVFGAIKKENYGQIKIVGNLPYYITKPIIEKIFTSSFEFDSYCIMVQKEVADKMRSNEGGKKYSFLSIISQVNKDLSVVCDAGHDSFFPSPDVESEVLMFKPAKNKIEILNKKIFFDLAKSLFLNRRKKITNNLNLSPFFNPKEKELLKKILYNFKISDNLRGENIPIDSIIRISNELWTQINETLY
jgi:16S rRNA (adenine1518-N6/adenine1519-N6)-dimethyltransferase